MNRTVNAAAAERLRDWWLSPPRHGMRRLIAPWEYRHLEGAAAIRIVGGGVATTAGAICLSYGVRRWAAFFFAVAVANFCSAGWEMTIARSTSRKPLTS